MLITDRVPRYDLPFRAAHQLVGRFERDSIAADLTPPEVRTEDLVLRLIQKIPNELGP